MAVRSKTIGRIGTILTFLCLTALLISFASDKWIQSQGRDNTGFENLGLWSVCFKDYYPPVSALVNRKYDGCWWVLNKELDDLRNFLIPSWYESTQVLMTLSLVLVLIVCILLIINLINCFPRSPYRHHIKRYLALSSGLVLILTAILLSVAILVFGVQSSNAGDGWLQNNDENYLSWSFGMAILADFLAMIAGMVLLFQFYHHRSEKGDSASEPKVFLTNEPPPGTNYHYSRNSNTARPVPDKGNTRDPGYVQRYNRPEDSRTSLMTGPPTERFAVSGAGEVYINNMATYDENYGDRQQRPPPRRTEQRPYPNQRSNAQPASTAPRSMATRQMGRQGYPLRLQEPSFVKPQGGSGSVDGSVDNDKNHQASKHPSLPEYVPKKNKVETATEDDSAVESDSDNTSARNNNKSRKKREKEDDVDSEKGGSRRKSRSKSKSGNKDSRDRSRSNSRSRKKGKTDTDTEADTPTQKRRSKKRRGKSSRTELSEEEGSVTGRRRRKHSKSRSRSRSRDRMTSDSQLDSDTGSTQSRSRKKRKEKEFSRMDAKRRSASEDNLSVRSGRKSRSGSRRSRKKYDGNMSDDFSGSEYSQKKSRRKGGRQSDGESRSRLRDFSDNESVKSRSKRNGEKPKGTYSSYYEY